MSYGCRTATPRSAAPGLRRWWMRADSRARRPPSAIARQTFSDQGKLAPVPPAPAPANVNHVTSGFRLRRYPCGSTRGIKDTTNVDAADGILVVQIRRLGTISREIFQPAACAALITICDERVRQCGMRSASRWPQTIFAGTGFSG